MKVHPAAELFPMFDTEALQSLADDIALHGLTEPVWLYDDPEMGRVLLDGRNRSVACELVGIEPATRIYTGSDPITFSISQNVQRRHLTAGQRAAVANAALPLYEAQAQALMLAGVAPNPGADLHQGDDAELTVILDADLVPEPKRAPRAADRAGKAAGASGRATAQYKRIAEQAPDLAEQVKAGTMALDRAERIIRDRDAEQRRVEQAKRDAEATESKPTIDLRHGDFREVLADLSGVHAIITDPPYPADFLPLLDDLAAWADKVLTEDGILAVLIGQTHLPEVYRRLEGHRPYRWTVAYMTEGPAYVSHPRRVSSSWKPLLVYGGGPRFSDVVRSSGDDKRYHKWGQNFDAFHSIIQRLTTSGQTVVDPFMGAGTTLLAAHSLGRHAIGSDTDDDAFRAASERLR
ncbi:DNA methyltransferase [Nocardioides sp.]|uniref:DNA methyltransferase n=1 Tax=Nocardioides sp. TaxID=35761 RepID=UPI002C7A8722|nr:DNA methyltransferase [Nocardioides sp.]HXH78726.1 DNA methyltransferase [Nocardioides sp.]